MHNIIILIILEPPNASFDAFQLNPMDELRAINPH